jgi:hypothetical protein
MAEIFSTSFEGIGIESGYSESVGDGCSIDWDNTEIARPVGGGNELLKCVSASTEFTSYAEFDLGSGNGFTKTFSRLYVRISAEGLVNGDKKMVMRGIDDGLASVWYICFAQKSTGDHAFRAYVYNDGAVILNLTYSKVVYLDTWYLLEMKYDNDDNTYEFRLDGETVNSGDLIGVHKNECRKFQAGFRDARSISVATTGYFDLWACDDADWLGAGLDEITIDLSEQISAVESVAGAMHLGEISINEVMGLAESLTSGVPLGLSKFDNITLAEFLTLLETIAPSRFEGITATEYLKILKDIGLSEFENITVNELVSAMLASDMYANVFDTVGVAEFVQILKDIGIDIDTAQNIGVSEVVNAVLLLAGIDRAEWVSIYEYVLSILEVTGVDVSQSVTISEYVYVTMVTVAGLMKVDFSVLKPSAAFSVAKPKITFH